MGKSYLELLVSEQPIGPCGVASNRTRMKKAKE